MRLIEKLVTVAQQFEFISAQNPDNGDPESEIGMGQKIRGSCGISIQDLCPRNSGKSRAEVDGLGSGILSDGAHPQFQAIIRAMPSSKDDKMDKHRSSTSVMSSKSFRIHLRYCGHSLNFV